MMPLEVVAYTSHEGTARDTFVASPVYSPPWIYTTQKTAATVQDHVTKGCFLRNVGIVILERSLRYFGIPTSCVYKATVKALNYIVCLSKKSKEKTDKGQEVDKKNKKIRLFIVIMHGTIKFCSGGFGLRQ